MKKLSLSFAYYFLLSMSIVWWLTSCSEADNTGEYEGYVVPNRPDSTLIVRGNTTAVRGGERIYLYKMDAQGNLELVAAQYPGAKGSFEFTVTVTEPTFFALNFYQRQQEGFWLYKSDVTVSAEAINRDSYFQVAGCRDNDLFREFDALQGAVGAQMQQMKPEEHSAFRRKKVKDFLEKAGSSIVGLSVANLLIPEEDLSIMEDIGENLQKYYPRSAYVSNYIKNLNLAKLLMVGQPAPDIKFRTSKGQEMSLSSFKGKYVFLDFWSSTMPNIQQSMLQLQALYAAYQPKGVEFISICMDKDHEAFVANSGKNVWPHVEDQLDSLSNCMNAYAVKMQNGPMFGYFIDPDGKIVAKGGLRGQKIATLLPKIEK